MKKRIFIAINLPEEIKDKIEKAVQEFRFSFLNDIRFLERKNWHITVTFLGYQQEEALPAIVQSLKETARNFPAPFIELSDFSYGPKSGPPRMIWLNGSADSSKAISDLKEDLENRLLERGVSFKKEHRRFNLHITLARFRGVKDLPEMSKKLNWHFPAKSLDLMESYLSRAGADYEVLQSADFKLK